MKEKPLEIVVLVFGCAMLTILILAVGLRVDGIQKNEKTILQKIEYQYVYVTENGDTDEDSAPSEQTSWLVKAYDGQIGVFQADGTLLQVIETNIKTLPKADRNLLEEGIHVQSAQELRSLIEAYTD